MASRNLAFKSFDASRLTNRNRSPQEERDAWPIGLLTSDFRQALSRSGTAGRQRVSSYNVNVPIKATCIDDEPTLHLIIGLNREDIDGLVAGGRLSFAMGSWLGPDSKIQIAFGETDEDILTVMPPDVDPE